MLSDDLDVYNLKRRNFRKQKQPKPKWLPGIHRLKCHKYNGKSNRIGPTGNILK
jgi:hypothetical protein